MKNKNQQYKCILCNSLTIKLHEIFYGHGVRQQYGIKYNLQCPLCVKCHALVHTKKEFYQLQLCRIMKMDYYRIRLAINTREYEYLETIKEKNLKKIMNFLDK